PDVRHFRPELSPLVSALLEKMLAKRPSQRQQTADQLIADVFALGQQLGLASVADVGSLIVTPASAGATWRSKVWQTLAAAAALIVAVAALEFALTPQRAGGGIVMRPRLKSPADQA